jgi:hypothetical protein
MLPISCVSITGVAVGTVQGTGTADCKRKHYYIRVPTNGRVWTTPDNNPFRRQTILISGAARAAPASLLNQNVANNARWAVDAAYIQPVREQESLSFGLWLTLQSATSDGYLYRVSYQANLLGRHI